MYNYDLMLFPNILGLTGGTRTFTSLTTKARDWKRSTRANGGFWKGTFTVEGTDEEKLDYFYTWLGSHVVERAGGMTTWEGMVFEMDLNHYGVRRRVSLDDMFNSVSTTYTEMAYGGDNMVSNHDFEEGNLSGWYSEGTVSATEEVTDHTDPGTWSAKVTGSGSLDDGHDQSNFLRQNINVSGGGVYQVSIWCRGGAGGEAGPARFGIRDPNDSDWIIKPSSVTSGTTWGQVTYAPVFGPSGGEILLYCYGGPQSGQAAYFDDAEVLEWGPSVFETDEHTDLIDDSGNIKNSIAKYGKKELRLTSDNLPKVAADNYAQSQLKLTKDSWPRAMAIGQSTRSELRVTVLGYVHTANWMYVKHGDNSTGNLYEWIEDMVGTTAGLAPLHGGTDEGAGDCQYLRRGRLALNTTQVNMKPSMDSRAWDEIMNNVVLGDASQNNYRAYVTTDRRLNLDQVGFTPWYYIRSGKIYTKLADTEPVNPWAVQPAIFRDMDYVVSSTPYDSPFLDIRDSWVDEVVVYSDGRIVPKTSTLSEADIWAAQAQALEFEIEDPFERDFEPMIWRP